MPTALGTGPVIRRAALFGSLIALVLLIGLLLVSPLMVSNLFNGEWLLFVGLVVGMLGFAVEYLAEARTRASVGSAPTRSSWAARRCCGSCCASRSPLAGVKYAGWYGLALGITPALAVLISLRGQHGVVTEGPDAPWSELSSALGALLAGSVLAMVLVNGGPIAMKILAGSGQDELVSQFFTAVIIARIPLFLFQAVQAALLPKLSALASAGKFDEFRIGFRKLVAVVAGVGAIAVVAAFAIGPWVIRLLYGSEFDLGHRTVGLLAAGSVLFMLAQAMAQAVIALGGHTKMALCWLAAVVTFVVVTALGNDLYLRVEMGLLVGCAVACIGMAALVRQLVRSGASVHTGDLIEAIHGRRAVISLGSERSLRSLSPPSAGWSLAGPTPAFLGAVRLRALAALAVSAECRLVPGGTDAGVSLGSDSASFGRSVILSMTSRPSVEHDDDQQHQPAPGTHDHADACMIMQQRALACRSGQRRDHRGVGVHGRRAVAPVRRPSRPDGRARHRRHPGRHEGRRPVSEPGRRLPDPRLRAVRRHDIDGLDLVFCGLPHGASQALVPELRSRVKHVVDLAADFRLTDPRCTRSGTASEHHAPELLVGLRLRPARVASRGDLRQRLVVAAPGCYPTAATLALAPLSRPASSRPTGIVVDAASGVSGAGRGKYPVLRPTRTSPPYGLLDHRHTPEIEQSLGAEVLFTPHLAPMNRGILATCYARPTGAVTTAEVLDTMHAGTTTSRSSS